MNLRFHLVVGLASACLLLPGCEIFGNDIKPERALMEARWVLEWIEHLDGDQVLVPKPGEVYSIEFRADGRVSGVEICNWCRGVYEVGPGDSISIQMGGCTEVGCLGLMYSNVMSRATSYDIRQGRLRIWSTNSVGEALVLVHRARAKDPDGA